MSSEAAQKWIAASPYPFSDEEKRLVAVVWAAAERDALIDAADALRYPREMLASDVGSWLRARALAVGDNRNQENR